VVGLQRCPVNRTVAELLGDETPGECEVLLAGVESRSSNLNKMLLKAAQPAFRRGLGRRHRRGWNHLLFPQDAHKVCESSSGMGVTSACGGRRMRPNSLVQIAGDQILFHIGGVQVRHGEPSPELLGRGQVSADDVVGIALLVQPGSEIAEMRLQ
jgi:hypothetical protein